MFRYHNDVDPKKKHISERDYILIWNLMPANHTEAVALIPTLINTDEDVVVKIINFLAEKKGMARQ